jgi:hypothetical protein
MNFYYDPILGLQYDYINNNYFILDIEMLPKEHKFDTETWLKYVSQTGIVLSDKKLNPVIEVIPNITNYKL